ncbi:MreB/Mbl protein [Musa troglodytarum]|uniref:MreB/Mbl protein n=1 Tax=Musa troglodytarum TaxID=320322 RepID=A0A9E7HD24_9LILI|nr:MreB/Mbl protein [Musa troglodytarum]
MDARAAPEDEAAPLLVEVSSCSCSSSDVRPARNHARDVHILSLAFLLVFSAYGAAQNLESTVNTEEDLGTISLGILYLSFTFFAVVASPVVRALGSKTALVLGSSGYLLFIASNLKPSWCAICSDVKRVLLHSESKFLLELTILQVGDWQFIVTCIVARSEFTKHIVTPALGVSGVGGAMAIYGAADATTLGKLVLGCSLRHLGKARYKDLLSEGT